MVDPWDVESGREVRTLDDGSGFRIATVSFSPDGEELVAGSDGGTATIWDVTTGREVLTLVGHSGFVTDATFSRDGRLLATSGSDATIRVWDASSGNEMLKLVGHELAVSSVDFSPDGTQLVTASLDGRVRVHLLDLNDLMRVAEKRLTRPLTDEECRRYLHLTRCSSS